MPLNNPSEVVVQDEGVEVSRRQVHNFAGAGVLSEDDAVNNRVNVTIEAGAGLPSASTTEQGKVELAISSEVDTGTDATRATTPDSLAGSNLGTRYVQEICYDFATSVAVGDGKGYVHIPPALNGMNLVYVHARVITAGTTNTLDIQIANVTDSVDMLSTKLTVDTTPETGSDTALAPAVIDTTKDDVATNDLLRIDVDAIHTTAPKGLIVTLGFQLP